ncbi:MAG: TetR/AcrR family transcriptional regulator [Pseudomonadota bacterium]
MVNVAIDTKRRGRPRGFDAEAGVVVAAQAFAARGYEAVGVAELCEALGIRPPSFYAAYGSKRDLFDRVVARYADGTGPVYDEAIAGARDLVDLRRRMLDAALGFYLRDGGVGCLVMASLGATGDADLRRALCEQVAARQAALEARARDLGADTEEAARVVAAISVAMLGLSAAARAGMDAAALRGAVDLLA